MNVRARVGADLLAYVGTIGFPDGQVFFIISSHPFRTSPCIQIAQLVAFLQDTTFYVVEEGRLSEEWQSPLQRRLASNADKPIGAAADIYERREVWRNIGSAEGGGNTEMDGWESVALEYEDERRRQRGLKSRENTENHESCPLIYTADAKTAKKHGLVLFEVLLFPFREPCENSTLMVSGRAYVVVNCIF